MDTTYIFVVILLALLFVAAFYSVKILDQCQRGVVLTLGKFTGSREPGLTILSPFVQTMRRADMRVKVMPIPSQDVITSDNVLRSDQGFFYGLRRRAARAGRRQGRGAVCEGQHALDTAFARESRDRRGDADRDRAAEPGACIAGHDHGLRHDREQAKDEGGREVLETIKPR